VEQSFVSEEVKSLLTKFLLKVIELTMCQAMTPWFELRPGFITGTVARDIISVLKFKLLDKHVGGSVQTLLDLLGFKLTRPMLDSLNHQSRAQLKKGYKALGYDPAKKSDDELKDALLRQIPSHALVLQKLARSWCMAPLKKVQKSDGIILPRPDGRVQDQ
jgi:hypothetical protein